MNDPVLTTIALTGFTVAFFHAAIPTHWLPFVIVARARGWTHWRTLSVAAFAGLGHVALTSVLGLVIAWFGFRLDERAGHLFSASAGGFLLAVAAVFAWRQFRGHGVLHHHPPGGAHHASESCGHEQDHSHWEDELRGTRLMKSDGGDWSAISGLFVMLTLSPCEAFLPVYLSGVHFGIRGFVLLSVILALGTLAGMLGFTWLSLVGLAKVRLQRFERNEAGLLAVIFAVLGLVMLLGRHAH